jgi:hypothetical protein
MLRGVCRGLFMAGLLGAVGAVAATIFCGGWLME